MLVGESMAKRLRAGSPSEISTDAGGNSSSSSTQQGAQLISVVTEIRETRVEAMASDAIGLVPPRMPREFQRGKTFEKSVHCPMGRSSRPCSLQQTSQLVSREASRGADCHLAKIS